MMGARFSISRTIIGRAFPPPSRRRTAKHSATPAVALEDLAGRHIRLRGVIEEFGGRPEIALSNPYQIEILD